MAGAGNLENYNKGLVPTKPQELDDSPIKGESAAQAAAMVGASATRVYEGMAKAGVGLSKVLYILYNLISGEIWFYFTTLIKICQALF